MHKKRMCLCWSWKIHNKCYAEDIISNECKLFLDDNKNERIKVIQQHIDKCSLETSSAVTTLHWIDKNKYLKSMMILDCALREVFANIWAIFNGEEDWSTARCTKYYDFFCKTSKNEEFKEHKYWESIRANKLYNLRSTLSHFMWIGWTISIWSLWSSNTDKTKTLVDSLAKEWIFFIDPWDFCLLLLSSWKIMIDTINDESQKWAPDYLIKLKKLYIKVNKDWAVEVTWNK